MAEEKGVEAVDRALALLACFDDDGGALGLADLSRRSGFHKSTILRIAVSLQRGGLMLRQQDGRYALGPQLSRLGAIYQRRFGHAELVRPALRDLADATQETASFYVREGDMRLCLYRAEPDRAIRHTLREGALLPLGAAASALVLRAWPPVAEPALAHVVEEGLAISRGARDPELAALAAPMLDQRGALRGALSVSGPIARFDAAACERIASLLRGCAAALARRLDALAP